MPTKLQIWSQAVRARDGKCMHCGCTEDLHAHHIKPKSTHPELSLDVSNGITLCYRCHKKEHERTAPVRVRGEVRPQRKTLMKKIEELEAMVKEREERIAELAKENTRLKKELEKNSVPVQPEVVEVKRDPDDCALPDLYPDGA